MPGAQVITKFNPTRLNAAIARANAASFRVAQADALARRHNTSKSGVKLRVNSTTQADLVPTGLQSTFEQGRQGGYEINPSGQVGIRRSFSRTQGSTYKVRAKAGGDKFALKFVGGDGKFAAYAVGGPMRPYPAMKPAASDWARKGYQVTARQTLAASGFR